jgi:hypothetical protein
VKLDDYLDSFQQVLDHPRHRAAQETLVELIRRLRACTNVDEGYEFQQALLGQILAVEKDRHAFRGVIKRMTAGKSPQAGAPEPQSGLDLALLSTWQMELDICERVARQFRCVGDALAWRVFGFEREYITTLARNQSPGMMAGKLGLPAELALVEKAWKEDSQFALMHDLTNCLRIGDISVFTDEGPHIAHGRRPGTAAWSGWTGRADAQRITDRAALPDCHRSGTRSVDLAACRDGSAMVQPLSRPV